MKPRKREGERRWRNVFDIFLELSSGDVAQYRSGVIKFQKLSANFMINCSAGENFSPVTQVQCTISAARLNFRFRTLYRNDYARLLDGIVNSQPFHTISIEFIYNLPLSMSIIYPAIGINTSNQYIYTRTTKKNLIILLSHVRAQSLLIIEEISVKYISLPRT